jgi:hypothetical protein
MSSANRTRSNGLTPVHIETLEGGENMVEEGKKAPAFVLPDQDGTSHKLSDYRGSWVVLFAYPKANTSG